MTLTSTQGSARTNPLIEPWTGPYGCVPFDKIETSDYEDAVKQAIELQNQAIDAIVRQRSIPTFENTIVALENSDEKLNTTLLALTNLEGALGDTVIMNLMTTLMPVVTDHQTSIMLNEALWERVKQVYDRKNERPDLTEEQLRLIDKTYRAFENSGATLTGEAREKYRKLNKELSDLQVKFGQNVTNDMANKERRLWLTKDQLSGLPESIVQSAREEAKNALAEEGRPDDESLYLFTVFYPSYSPVMKYADNRDVREKMYRLYTSRNVGGEYDNQQILKDIANIRLEIAKLFGHKNFAEYALTDKMAKNPEGVYNLLNDLRDAYYPAMKQELEEVEAFARESEGDDFVLQPWDYSYWTDKLKTSQFSFNDEDMRPYFELSNTIKGVFGLANKLYGYNFKELKDIPVYHPDVTAYEVTDADGSLLGMLYTDFFYRPGKSPGAWMTEFRSESKDESGAKVYPLISIVTNFNKPTSTDPALLTPYEVETFLHEFGHALHGLSANSTYRSLSGTNVAHDFVELFSQFNENYLTEKEFLDGFAKHYKTGKKMPADLIKKFVDSSRFGAAYSCIRQLDFGFLDMAYSTIEEPLRASSSVPEFEAEATETVMIFPSIPESIHSPSFGHIFSGGYAAGYYGYKWSEVLDADAFDEFKEHGIFNKKTAAKFKKMLQTGDSKDPMELYIEFRGKQPTVDALMRRDGIKK